MRNSFVRAMSEIMDKEERAILLIGDIGAYLLRDIKSNHPQRFLNMGVSEANMMNVAAGLALEGWIPFVYTITSFVTSRCYDQIRVGVGYHGANVKIVGTGSGVSYSIYGPTHHSLEDISLMSSIPGMVVLSPADGPETIEIAWAAAIHRGPVYIRLMLNVPPIQVQNRGVFEIGKSRLFRDGSDLTLIVTGELVREALGAAELLQNDGLSARVINMSTIKPVDVEAVKKAIEETQAIFTIEEHSIIGGLGSMVASVIAEHRGGKRVIFKRIGIEDCYLNRYGQKSEVYKYLQLDCEGIYKRIKNEVNASLVLFKKANLPSAYEASS